MNTSDTRTEEEESNRCLARSISYSFVRHFNLEMSRRGLSNSRIDRRCLKDFLSLDGFGIFFILLLINDLVLPLESAGKLSDWDQADYQSNKDFYRRRRTEKRFDPEDHLRLDRLSSPRFHPVNGKTLVYLHDKHHLTNVKLSTTTLYWLDLESNRTKELTRPTWGKHDKQVKQIDLAQMPKTTAFRFHGSMERRFSFSPTEITRR